MIPSPAGSRNPRRLAAGAGALDARKQRRYSVATIRSCGSGRQRLRTGAVGASVARREPAVTVRGRQRTAPRTRPGAAGATSARGGVEFRPGTPVTAQESASRRRAGPEKGGTIPRQGSLLVRVFCFVRTRDRETTCASTSVGGEPGPEGRPITPSSGPRRSVPPPSPGGRPSPRGRAGPPRAVSAARPLRARSAASRHRRKRDANPGRPTGGRRM
jgi:hypothetical protein